MGAFVSQKTGAETWLGSFVGRINTGMGVGGIKVGAGVAVAVETGKGVAVGVDIAVNAAAV